MRETSAPLQPTVHGKLPVRQFCCKVIEGFFCNKVVDKKQLQRGYEELKRGDAPDKERQLSSLKQFIDSVESIDVHKEAQELQSLLSGGRSAF